MTIPAKTDLAIEISLARQMTIEELMWVEWLAEHAPKPDAFVQG